MSSTGKRRQTPIRTGEEGRRRKKIEKKKMKGEKKKKEKGKKKKGEK